MDQPPSRAVLFVHVWVAHLIGLFATGLYGSIGTTAGFGSDVGTSMFLGGVLSIPWFCALLLVIWFFGTWLSRHMLVLCLAGPFVVCGSYVVVLGRPFLDAVAVSCVTSSIVLLIIVGWDHGRTAWLTRRGAAGRASGRSSAA